MSYKIGNQRQTTFFTPRIDEYLGQKDPVRGYDAFGEVLDHEELGIET